MKQKTLFFAFLIFSFFVNGQINNNATLVTIDGKNYTISDFRRTYEKNLDVIDSEEAKDIQKNIELFINYKLKVKEAYRLNLDTLDSYKQEIEIYRNQLSAPYLQDSIYLNKLIKDAYFRLKNEVKVKHILLRLPKNARPKDTLAVYQKLNSIRDSILRGESFDKMAVRYSEDPSARDNSNTGYKGNKGDLGYFSAFKLVFAFEETAYTTPVGEISKPFKTSFGYHILQVDDLRPSRGEVEVAHILISDTTKEGEKLINEVYQRLENKEHFKPLARKYSNDNNSRTKGGKLKKFGTGIMPKEFEDVAFSLEKEQDYSKPFRTKFGWHIVKLIKKHPVQDFKDLQIELRRRVLSGSRAKLSRKAVIDRLKLKYIITEAEDNMLFFNSLNADTFKISNFKENLFTINNKSISKKSFLAHLKKNNTKPIFDTYKEYKIKEILNFYKENLEASEPEFAYLIEEYRDGLLLFELMQREVWNKASKDTIGLDNFYKNNFNKYNNKALKQIKGQVISDYQNKIEKDWLEGLRKNSKIKIHNKAVKTLVQFYRTNE